MGGEKVLELIWMAQGGIEGLGRYLPLNLPPTPPPYPTFATSTDGGVDNGCLTEWAGWCGLVGGCCFRWVGRDGFVGSGIMSGTWGCGSGRMVC